MTNIMKFIMSTGLLSESSLSKECILCIQHMHYLSHNMGKIYIIYNMLDYNT